MKKLNIIIVYNREAEKVLMCLRSKEPYKGKYNFVGGKVEPGEDIVKAAYRELQEETGITSKDITLKHFMNFQYILSDIELEVFVGRLNKDVELTEEINKLYWISLNENFFDLQKYAGQGNIGHMLAHIQSDMENSFF